MQSMLHLRSAVRYETNPTARQASQGRSASTYHNTLGTTVSGSRFSIAWSSVAASRFGTTRLMHPPGLVAGGSRRP